MGAKGETSRFKLPLRKWKRLFVLFIFLLLVSTWLILLTPVWLKRDTVLSQPVQTKSSPPPPVVLLSVPMHTQATTDVRGILGSPSVLLEDGTDWLQDRWQSAPSSKYEEGTHWVNLEFDSPVHVTHIVLDWETAHSEDYKMEGKTHDHEIAFTLDTENYADVERYRSEREWGRNPAVRKFVYPLHVIHTWNMTGISSWQDSEKIGIDSLRLEIRAPVKKHLVTGVSLWKVEVYGYRG
jgi:hypothetical protein